MQQGLIWAPYIIQESVSVISDKNFNPSKPLISRYSQTIILNKNERRKEKIKDLFKTENPST